MKPLTFAKDSGPKRLSASDIEASIQLGRGLGERAFLFCHGSIPPAAVGMTDQQIDTYIRLVRPITGWNDAQVAELKKAITRAFAERVIELEKGSVGTA